MMKYNNTKKNTVSTKSKKLLFHPHDKEADEKKGNRPEDQKKYKKYHKKNDFF